MKMPWLSRSLHAEMMDLLTTQLGELKVERQILLDRLATLGLGGPLFSLTSLPEASLADEAIEETDELEQLLHLRRRPSKLADALTRKAYRDHYKVQAGPSVKWIPKAESISAALDQAEAAGKKQA